MTELTDNVIASTLGSYSFVPTNAQCDSIRKYIALLVRWNAKVSLTTVIDPIEILRFHFGESLFATSVVHIDKGRLADVGSGAGFPGMALVLANPQLEVTLIESNAKKAAFLAEVARELGLTKVRVFRERMQDVCPQALGFDFITARALGNHDELLSWARSSLISAGKLALWLGRSEILRISSVESFTWQDPALIPQSEGRFILIGTPR
jgi:16S rRNA (guanine527-N7)-methyltransferase